MRVKKLLLGTSLVSYGLISGWIGSASAPERGQPTAELALRQLQSDFHEASTTADYELMLSLWAENAVFSSPAATVTGRTAIADFFASAAGWGRVASLSPSYKSTFDIHGSTAAFAFECILVDCSGMDPVSTPLSTLPFGSQNPDVEIVQHSQATCTAVKENGRWVFQTFMGGGGPL